MKQTRFAFRHLVLGMLALGCHDRTPPAPEKPKGEKADVELSETALAAAALSTQKVEASTRKASVMAQGTVDFVPNQVARVGPSVAGRVGSIAVAIGQRVKKGATLLVIDSVDVGRARADLVAAKSKLTQTEAELSREQKLMAGGASSERAVLAAETEKHVAETGVRAAEDRLRMLGASSAQGQSSFPLVSPIDGAVLDVTARLGQPVGTTDTLVVVGETRDVWLSIDVYERDVSKVHVGDDVRVNTVAFPNRTFEGKVDFIATAVDPKRKVLEARIVLPNPDGALKPGMTAAARILGGALPDAGASISIPKGALQTIDGQPFVFIEKSKGKFELRPVERGDEAEGYVQIARGLSGGEMIVVDGSFILKSEVLREQMGSND